MKKVLLVLGMIIVLLVAAVIAIPFLVPTETLVATAVEQGEKATGREITVGDASFSVLPTTKVSLGDVTVANAPGGKADKLVTLKGLDVEVDLLAIISGKVEVKRFVLVEPVINVEKDKAGRFNFEFDKPEGASDESASSDSAGDDKSSGDSGIESIRLDDVRIENAQLNYSDAQTGVSHSIANLNASVSLPGLDQPMNFDGDLVWQGEKITITTKVDDLNGVLAGGTTALSAKVGSTFFDVAFNGKAGQSPAPTASGKADVAVADLPALLKWVGAATGDAKLPKTIGLKADVNVAMPKIALAGMEFKFDSNTVTGAARAVLADKPSLYADLSAGDLDLRPYMPADQGSAGKDAKADAAPAGNSDWSDDPIDLSGLRAANAEILLKANSIKTGIVDPGATNLHVTLRNAKLEAQLKQLAMFDGGITGVVKADARKAKSEIAAQIKINGLQTRDVLAKFADYSDLLGRLDADMNLTTRGATQRQFVSALTGSGKFVIKDGALIGVNLAEQMKGMSPDKFKATYDKTKKTDFAEMGASFTAKNGVISNKDFRMLAPLVRVTGSGTVPLPPRKVDYRVVPKLVASLSGQGGGDAAGIGFPLLIKGSWEDPSILPDLEGMVKGVLQAPGDVVEGVVKQVGKGGAGVGKVLQGLTGGDSKPAASGKEEKKSPLGGALKGLNSLIK